MNPPIRPVAILSLPLLLALAASPARAATADGGWSATLYVQEAFPKQTRTNAQIDQINAAFGTSFDTWDDIHNLSLGGKLYRHLAPRWWVGLEADWSAGAISGKATIDTLAGPARVSFEQRYSVYADLMAAGHFLLCDPCRRVEPFVLAGAGVAYEKDRTTLTLRNDFLDEGLLVRNDGWFPVATVGLGLNVPLTARRSSFLEAGVAYFWGRLEHRVPASGSLAPAPEVTADTDSSGPNYWLGFAWRFGAPAP